MDLDDLIELDAAGPVEHWEDSDVYRFIKAVGMLDEPGSQKISGFMQNRIPANLIEGRGVRPYRRNEPVSTTVQKGLEAVCLERLARLVSHITLRRLYNAHRFKADESTPLLLAYCGRDKASIAAMKKSARATAREYSEKIERFDSKRFAEYLCNPIYAFSKSVCVFGILEMLKTCCVLRGDYIHVWTRFVTKDRREYTRDRTTVFYDWIRAVINQYIKSLGRDDVIISPSDLDFKDFGRFYAGDFYYGGGGQH